MTDRPPSNPQTGQPQQNPSQAPPQGSWGQAPPRGRHPSIGNHPSFPGGGSGSAGRSGGYQQVQQQPGRQISDINTSFTVGGFQNASVFQPHSAGSPVAPGARFFDSSQQAGGYGGGGGGGGYPPFGGYPAPSSAPYSPASPTGFHQGGGSGHYAHQQQQQQHHQQHLHRSQQVHPQQHQHHHPPGFSSGSGGQGVHQLTESMRQISIEKHQGPPQQRSTHGHRSSRAQQRFFAGSGQGAARPPPISTGRNYGSQSGTSSASGLDDMHFLWHGGAQQYQEAIVGPASAFPYSTLTPTNTQHPLAQSLFGPQSAVVPGERVSYGLFSNSALMHHPLAVSVSNRDMTSGEVSPNTAASALSSAGILSPTAPSYPQQFGATGGGSISGSGSSDPGALVQVKFPRRPALGSKGRVIRVRANFFEFLSVPSKEVYQYDVKITPEVPPSLNRRIFKELMIQYGADKLGGTVAVYDGRRSLYTPSQLTLGDASKSIEFEVIITDDDRPGTAATSAAPKAVTTTPAAQPRKFSFRLKFQSSIDMSLLSKFINGQQQQTPLDALQAIDVIMRHRPSMTLTTVGRSFFTRNDSKSLGDGAECWMGYHQAIRPAQGKLMMNIDVSATAFYEPGPVLNFLARNLSKRSAADLKTPLKIREIDRCERLLRGVKIQVTHRGEIKRKYKVNGVTRTACDQTYFKYTAVSSNGAPGQEIEISVADYFLRHYNFQLRFPYLPCLRVGSTQRSVFLPMEVCDIVPGQRFLRKLNEQQTAQMIRLTCQTPDRRANKIAQAIAELGLDKIGIADDSQTVDNAKIASNPDDASYLSSFGVRISDEMMTVPARVLDPPTIQYHPTSREPLITPREGAWNLRDKKVVQPATLHSWSVICFGSVRDMPQHKIDHFLREMISTCRDTGLNITNPHPPAIYGDPNTGSIEETMRAAWQAAGEAVQSFPQLILCILPNTGVPLYAEIKRIGDTVLGVPTQCVQVKHTFQPKKQYCANVCLKINSKLGGVNSFIVKNPSVGGDQGLPWVAEVPTIIFGADVTHPAHGESRTSGSVCALVGSLDRLASRYAATVRLQLPRREVMMELESMTEEILKIFYLENNQIAPQRILFYRDGISESQFYDVATAELTAIRAACERLQAGYRPTITYVAVQKRHHARVFAMNPKDADRSGNIPAGTVIDSHITHPNEFDFYICSHAGLQGTSRPTYYHVLHDENGFQPDALHELTYRLCYGYARCTRSVSVVPPAYYADLVAFRAKYHLKSAGPGTSGSGPYTFGTASLMSGSVSGRDQENGGGPGEQPQTPSMENKPSSPSTPTVGGPLSSAAAGSASSVSNNDETESLVDADKKNRRRRGRSDTVTREEELEMMKMLQSRLAIVKPELQKVMYFM